LSVSLFGPRGLFDPVLCRNSKWIITIAVITSGSRKCSVKNCVNVVLSTVKPPHTHCTIFFPMYGIST
jgi:hypothetical protein